jgi:acyl-CoA thioester hydrolase
MHRLEKAKPYGCRSARQLVLELMTVPFAAEGGSSSCKGIVGASCFRMDSRWGMAALTERKAPSMVQATPDVTLVWHKTSLRVPLYEVDLGQAVYHGNYFHLLELGRESFLRHLGYPYRRFMDQNMHLTIVELTCNYRKSLRYDDEIEVRTAVRWWRSRSLAFDQAIYRAGPSGEPDLCAGATLNMVCVRFSGQPAAIPKDFLDLLERWVNRES